MNGADRDRVIEQVIADYLAAEDAGTTPDRAAILAAHPDVATELQGFFREHDRFDRLAAPLREDVALTVDLGVADAAPGGAGGLPAGKQVRYFGDYEILEELGRGGMGVVYRARQVSLNRQVALKMIRSGAFADADDLRRFHNEVKAVALLDHPGVVPVYEVGELEGQRYFSMKLIEGGGLPSHLDAFKANPRAAAQLVAEAAEAMAHAHARGVLHRDIKPANILVDTDGHPLISDFGLAKRLGEDQELTRSGAILGTPAYMSPEQSAGRRGTVTTATDIYGLGAVLYSLLTGRPPFVGESLAETLDAVRTSSPEGPRRLDPKIPRDLETICLKCLEKEPGRRYATAQELADDLSAWLENRPIAARPAGMLERAALFARRKPAAAAAFGLAAMVVVLIGVGGAIARFWMAAERARTESESARGVAELARAESERARGEAERARSETEAAHTRLAAVEYGRAMQAAHGELRDENVVGALALLEGTRPELRGWEWRYVSSLCHPELASFEGPRVPFEPYFDEMGGQIATFDTRGKLCFWDAGTGSKISGFDGRRFDGLDTISRDGTRMLFPGDRGLSIIIRDLHSGSVLVTLKGHEKLIYAKAFDPGGARVVTASEDGTAKVWDARSGKEFLTLGTRNPMAVYYASFSPDGTKVATAGADGTARIWDAGSGRELLTLRGHERGVDRLEFRRDGSRIVTVSQDKTARVWDVATGALLLTLRGHTRRVTSASFSRDGARIATSSEDRTARIYDATTGTLLLTLCGHTSPVWSARFSPDGSRLITAVAGGRHEPARIWDARRGSGPFQLDEGRDSSRASFSPDGSRVATIRWGNHSPTSRILDSRTGRPYAALEDASGSSIEFSRDGTRIVTAGADRTAKVRDARDGKILRTLEGHGDFLTAASFSPDGSRIVTASRDGTARLWDSRDGTMLRELKLREGRINSAVFSPDGSRILTSGGDGAAIASDVASGVEVLRLISPSRGVSSAVYSPDGTRIATGEDNLAKVWDATTGADLSTLRGHTGQVWSVAFSPDGSRIVTASNDGTMKLWDARSGTEVLTLKGHTDAVRTASFSTDGTRIVSGSDDGTVRIWDARPFAVIQAERAEAPTTTAADRTH